MPKRITVYLIVIIAVASLLVVLACGTGDKGTVSRLGVNDVINAGNDTSGGDGPGGDGDTHTGACVVLASGDGFCYQGQSVDRPSCNHLQGTFHAGQTCANYGYPSCTFFGSGYYGCF